jgi:hypothetical protein
MQILSAPARLLLLEVPNLLPQGPRHKLPLPHRRPQRLHLGLRVRLALGCVSNQCCDMGLY